MGEVNFTDIDNGEGTVFVALNDWRWFEHKSKIHICIAEFIKISYFVYADMYNLLLFWV